MKHIHTVGLTLATAASLILTPAASAATNSQGVTPPPAQPYHDAHEHRIEFLASVLEVTPEQLKAQLQAETQRLIDRP